MSTMPLMMVASDQQHLQQLVLLPLGYSPGPHDIVCDAADVLVAARFPGNRQFETLVNCYQSQFENSATERDRQAVVIKILSQIGQRGGRFLVQHPPLLRTAVQQMPRWAELSADLVFEKIHATLFASFRQQSALLAQQQQQRLGAAVGGTFLPPPSIHRQGNLPRKVTVEGPGAALTLSSYSQPILMAQQQQQQQQQLHHPGEPTEFDVLYVFGPGTEVIRHHPGNVHFRRLVEQAVLKLQQQHYGQGGGDSTTNSEKEEAILAVEITKCIWQSGGRFLQRSSVLPGELWAEMPNHMAIDLTQRALSEQGEQQQQQLVTAAATVPQEEEHSESSSVASDPPPSPRTKTTKSQKKQMSQKEPKGRARKRKKKTKTGLPSMDGDKIEIVVPRRSEHDIDSIVQVNVRKSSLQQPDKDLATAAAVPQQAMAGPPPSRKLRRKLVKEQDVTAQDVLLGVGKNLALHQGNGFYHGIIKKMAFSYLDETDEAAKEKLVRKVIQRVRQNGGRFLERVSEEVQAELSWWELDNDGDAVHEIVQTSFACRVYRADPLDWKKKLKECQSRAQQGEAAEQYQLGCCYKLGQVVNQDLIIANHWFRCAVRQGHESAKVEWTSKLGTEQVDAREEYEQAVQGYRHTTTTTTSETTTARRRKSRKPVNGHDDEEDE
eukprot:CAMPEP_0168741440 /NCGR_PEP_ID=MMETSP0724-20121128/12515_1 /TAXON_ID=265536 /ORGANISM="Amphiprora sp., Strain CCMP467" /LENGTH=662 /DNA_ID=CAMNT_0008788945 /DNA_START=19 /DNA_END=2004 /DNA_ORIENTATION=+